MHTFRGRGWHYCRCVLFFQQLSITFCYLYSLDMGKHKIYIVFVVVPTITKPQNGFNALR